MIFRKLFEKRALSGLAEPEPFLVEIFGGQPTYSGETVTSETAILNSNVYTCASILGGDIGKLPIQLFKRKGNSVEKDTTHPASYLLSTRPNPYMSAYTFKELMEVHQVAWGNAYANIEWDAAGYPKALWPLDPSLTDVWLDNDGAVWYIITIPKTGERRKIPWYDVLHLKQLSKSGLKGITPISVIREKIGIQQASDKFIGSFYANGTSTKGVLKTDSKLQDEAKTRAREEWQKLNSGLSNAHRIAILDAGLEYENVGMPLADAQFIETQKFGISEIAKIYKIPPHKLGLLERATFSNIEHQSLEYVKNTLQPRITNWEQEIDYKLFTKKEHKKYYSKFNLASELRGDSKSRAEYYKEMIGIGVYSINDIRLLEEKNSIGEKGEKHYFSLNYTTLDILEEYQKSKVGIVKGGEGGGED